MFVAILLGWNLLEQVSFQSVDDISLFGEYINFIKKSTEHQTVVRRFV
jgi:hypothetical protein